MWEDTFESKILRLEGFPDTEEISCIIKKNNKHQETLSPYNHHKPLTLHLSSLYEFEFYSSSYKRSIKLKPEIFKDDGAQWIPLYEYSELLSELPEEVQVPRFLMILSKTKSLQVIEEIIENSEESIILTGSDEYMPEIKLLSGRNDYQPHKVYLANIDSQSTAKIEELSEIISEIQHVENDEKAWHSENITFLEIPTKEDQIFTSDFEDAMIKYENLEELHEIEKKRLKEYDKNFVDFVSTFKEQTKRNQDREEALCELISEKENELQAAQNEIFELRSYTQKLEIENKRLIDQNSGFLSHFCVCETSTLIKEVSLLRKAISDLQQEAKNMIPLSEFHIKMAEKESIIYELQKQYIKNRTKSNDLDTKDSYNFSLITDELDEVIRKNWKSMQINEPIIKDKEQNYIFRNKKITMLVKNGRLFCRIGGILKGFKEYLKE